MWGYNENGQIKDVTTNCKLSPEKIMDNVAFASLGDDHSAVIKTNGDLYTWGDNKYGQLGDGIKNYSEKEKTTKLWMHIMKFITELCLKMKR